MAHQCSACNNNILDLNYMKCSKCTQHYDLACLKITSEYFNTISQEQKKEWLCPSCLCSQPKRDNSATPIRTSNVPVNNANTKNENVNTVRGSKQKRKSASPTSDLEASSLISEIRLLRLEITEIRQELTNQISAISKTLDEKLGEYKKIVEAKDIEIALLKSSISQLQQQAANREQYLIRNELEIIGIPEQANENLTHIVLLTAKKMGVDLTETDLDDITRAGPKNPKGMEPQSSNKRSRPIIVKLVRRQKRNDLVSAARTRRNATTENITECDPPQKIYINERLTKENRYLFREARLRANTQGYRFCWVHNGAILIKHAEGKPAIRIQSTEDLDQKLGPAQASEHVNA